MKIKVLGSSGARLPGHNLPAFLLDDFMLLDAGTSSCVLSRVAQQKISHVLITHAHLDHINSIPFFVENMISGKYHPPLTVISGKDVISELKKNIFNNRIWPDFTVIPNKKNPILKLQPLATGSCMKIKDYNVCTARVNHTVPCYGYIIEDSKGKALVYTGDTGPTGRIWRMMAEHNVKALIVEVAFPNSQKKLALLSGHLTPALLAEEIKKMKKVPERIYVTHINPVYRTEVKKELKKIKGVNIDVINDRTVIKV
jgi:ribonuclease BN (tRNA processing enzyme)